MNNYSLRPDESVLYQETISIEKRKGNTELLLTNLNLVFITTIKKAFTKSQVDVETYPVEEIKTYNGAPQIKQKDSHVQIFLVCGEISAVFPSMFEARKFVSTAMHLLTGKSAAERGADKVKNAVGLVDNTLGINTIGTVKSALETGITGTLIGGIGRKIAPRSVGNQIIGSAFGLARDVIANNSTTTEPTVESTVQPQPYNDQLDALKKMKELVDAGVLTQEEFDTKKKQLLGL